MNDANQVNTSQSPSEDPARGPDSASHGAGLEEALAERPVHAESQRSTAGKAVIVWLFAITVAMALFAIWYRQQTGRRTRAAFGVDHAQRIQNAVRVEMFRLPTAQPTLKPAELPAVRDANWKIATSISGMTHVRGALMEDRSFDWKSTSKRTKPKPKAQWRYLLRFVDKANAATHLAIDLKSAQLRIVELDRELSITPILNFMRRFLHTQYPEDKPSQPDEANRDDANRDNANRDNASRKAPAGS